MAIDFGEKDRKKWVNGKEEENKSDKIVIKYEVGNIYTSKKIDKTLGSLVSFAERIGFCSPGSVDGMSYSMTSGFVDGGFQSEFSARDLAKGNKSMSASEKKAGDYIFPYIVGYPYPRGKAKENADNRYSAKEKKFEVDTHGIASHYLYTHCYYNFKLYGDDFAKMWGIEKLEDTDIYGFKWWLDFTHYVSWRMIVSIYYAESIEHLNFDCMLKEDLSPPDAGLGLVKWAATAIGSVVGGTAGAAIRGFTNAADTMIAGVANTSLSSSMNRASDEITFRDWTGNPNDRDVPMNSSAAVKAQNDIRDAVFGAIEKRDNADAWGAMKRQVGGAFSKGVGRAFSGFPRIFFGGRASYSSSIDEFIANKAHIPVLKVEARTSQSYQNFWVAEMNRRLSQWDFWFGNDPEVALKKGFGMDFGVGYEEKWVGSSGAERFIRRGVLKDLHGLIQLGENLIFGGKMNPFIEEWIEGDKFVYQLRKNNPVYHRKSEDFFQGFRGELTFGYNREGRVTKFGEERTEHFTTLERSAESGAYSFAYFWCSGGVIPGGISDGFDVEEPDLTNVTGETGNELVKYDPSTSQTTKLDWNNYLEFKDKSYQKIRFPEKILRKEFRFGEGSETVIAKYMRGWEKEEEIHQSPDPANTTWVLAVDTSIYDGGYVLFREIRGERTVVSQKEVYSNPSGFQFAVPIGGTSGLEGWGNNPPNSFNWGGGNGGLPTENPNWAQHLASGGMTLPNTNPLNTNQFKMPAEIQSKVNTEQVFVPLEMPQLNPLGAMNINQEFINQSIADQQRVHQSLHDKVDSQQKKDKEKQTSS
jgi:hypothetical protein